MHTRDLFERDTLYGQALQPTLHGWSTVRSIPAETWVYANGHGNVSLEYYFARSDWHMRGTNHTQAPLRVLCPSGCVMLTRCAADRAQGTAQPRAQQAGEPLPCSAAQLRVRRVHCGETSSIPLHHSGGMHCGHLHQHPEPP